jgi:hypothetical protein
MTLRTVYDNRGGRPPCWVILPEGSERLVQVPDTMRKGVVFLYARFGGELRPVATAFFAGYPVTGLDNPSSHFQFLLTAQHVIAKVKRYSDDAKVLVRMNTKEGPSAIGIETETEHWLHLNPNVDCALLPWHPPPDMHIDFAAFTLSREGGSATDEMIAQEGIDIGDEVFTVGLFRKHVGDSRNEPIVRVGNIAAMPVDPIHTELFGDMRVILIESRSIGGLSGSPVFIHMGFIRWRGDQVQQAAGRYPFMFLGLVHGHWDVKESEIDTAPGADATFVEGINTGIGIVVPAEQILGAITPYLEAQAEVIRQQIREDGAATMDSAVPNGPGLDATADLMGKLLQVPKEEADEVHRGHQGT